MATSESDKANWRFLTKIFLLTVLALLVFSAAIYYAASEQQKENTRFLAETFLSQTERALGIWLNAEINVIQDLANDVVIEDALADPNDARLRECAREVIENAHVRRSSYTVVSLVPALKPGEIVHTVKNGAPYDITNGMVYADSIGGGAVGIDVLHFDYGKAIFEKGAGLVIGAAKKNAMPGKPPVIMLSARVEKDGTFVGMVAFGISLEYFSMKFIANANLGLTVTMSLLDNRGYVIANADWSEILQDSKSADIRKTIEGGLANENEFLHSSLAPDRRQVMIKSVKAPGNVDMETVWFLVLSKDANEIFGAARNILAQNLFFMTVFTVFVTFIIIFSLGTVFLHRIEEEKKRTEAANGELERLSLTDQLTGLPNRRFFDAKLLFYSAKEYLPLTIASFDLDGLKIVNDMLGHQSGDDLLTRAAVALCGASPRDAVVCRVGGDEFAAVYPNCDEAGAAAVADLIQCGVNDLALENEDAPLRISYGFATRRDMDKHVSELFKEADDSMYSLKQRHSSEVRGELFRRLCDPDDGHVKRLQSLIERFVSGNREYRAYLPRMTLLAQYQDIGDLPFVVRHAPEFSGDVSAFSNAHAERGFRIASLFPQISDIARLIMRHHERWDGEGVLQFNQDKLPIECRIVAVASCYLDDVESGRSPDDAIAALKRKSGTFFDPDIVDKFLHALTNEGRGNNEE